MAKVNTKKIDFEMQRERAGWGVRETGIDRDKERFLKNILVKLPLFESISCILK